MHCFAMASLQLDHTSYGLNHAQGFFDHGVVGMTRDGRCVWVIKVSQEATPVLTSSSLYISSCLRVTGHFNMLYASILSS